jgi:hypothetical protein
MTTELEMIDRLTKERDAAFQRSLMFAEIADFYEKELNRLFCFYSENEDEGALVAHEAEAVLMKAAIQFPWREMYEQE